MGVRLWEEYAALGFQPAADFNRPAGKCAGAAQAEYHSAAELV